MWKSCVKTDTACRVNVRKQIPIKTSSERMKSQSRSKVSGFKTIAIKRALRAGIWLHWLLAKQCVGGMN